MLIIGLTGGIASGKSTVAKMLVKKGAHLIDADQIAREVVQPDLPAWQEIVDWLGETILLPDRSIDRVKLAGIVFNDSAKLEKLNEIIHPRVADRFAVLSSEIAGKDPDAVIVYDIPLLIEAGMHSGVDLILLVYVSPEIQLERLQQRDHLSRIEAENRLSAQMPLGDKKKYADAIIDNSGSINETAAQAEQFWDKIMQGGC
ncbi:MAG: dephospho-CoA kinase [Bacillota bacterium]|nr:dephospho-CoA kinase [Bacillota bacterium]MDW7728523.1 dephospho-CoA kinase [Bacillota bacterium]